MHLSYRTFLDRIALRLDCPTVVNKDSPVLFHVVYRETDEDTGETSWGIAQDLRGLVGSKVYWSWAYDPSLEEVFHRDNSVTEWNYYRTSYQTWDWVVDSILQPKGSRLVVKDGLPTIRAKYGQR
jgi:hypothetical protein